jgi:REP element-mobilizing transposase RayT
VVLNATVGAPLASRLFQLNHREMPLETSNVSTHALRMEWKENRHQRGHAALRRGRYTEKNRIYHVTTATAQRKPVFGDFALGRIVVRTLRRQDESGLTETLAFVVMPDHLHWLVRITGGRDLSSCVRAVKSYSARQIKKASGNRGLVWQRCFYDHALRDETEIENAARYIVANPLRAGLVKRFGDYPLWDAKWV